MDSEQSLLIWVLGGTCLIHWLTVFLLIRRVRSTEKPLVWNLLGLAIGLLALQKSYVLAIHYIEIIPPVLNLVSVGLGFLVAGLLLGGILLLSPFLYLLQRNKELLAVIEERNAIIHQFHEQIARSLQKIQIAMEVGKPANFIIEHVAEMSHLLQEFLENLKAGVLLGNKFHVALKTLVEDLSGDATFPFSVHVDSAFEDKISREQGMEFLHILREAIRNSLQYSQATKGQVTAHITATDLILEVADNGRGFEVDLVRAQGHGLGNMVNRASKMGARLKVQSQLSKGTSIIIEVPFNGKSFDNGHSVPPLHSSVDVSCKAPVG
jgi:two-component sensor histidine kinase